ncbi:MAG: hypothetical protein KDC46_06595 [Thermoleophilia bacterium]|nr:hypothetical protein [Thermoleophilia bacterium]
MEAAGAATTDAAKRLADAADRQKKSDDHKKVDDKPRQQEPKPADKPDSSKPTDQSKPEADAKDGASSVQPPDKDQPPRAIPRPKAALSSAKEGADKADKRSEGKPVAEAIKEHIEQREQAGDDQTDRRKRLEEAQHQGDLQIELALDDAHDGKPEEPGYEKADAEAAIKDRGLVGIEQYDATGRALIAEQLGEESARFKDAEDEQLAGRARDEQTDQDQQRVDFAGMSAEERAVAYQTTISEQALLKREADVLDGGLTGTPTDLGAVDIDDDGHGGDLEGLDNDDRDARQEEIQRELARLTDLDDQIAGTFTDEELDALAAKRSVAVTGENGDETSYELSDDLLGNLRDHRDRVAADRPELVPDAAVADQPDPEGAGGADPTDPAADTSGTTEAGGAGDAQTPPPPSDDELLDAAAADGVIDANARDRFTFNEQGELTYAAQPGDGYWQAAEHVAPPAGEDFATHWRNTWTENSMRNQGVPDEQFVGVDQPVVIPGYTRDQFTAAYAPQPQTDSAGGADGAEPTPPPRPEDVEVTGHQDGDTTTLTVDGHEVTVQESDFAGGVCTVDGTLVDHADVHVDAEGGGYDATIERTRGLDGSDPRYTTTGTAPAAAGDAPATDPGSTDPGTEDSGATDTGSTDAAADVDPDATVMVGGHEVYAHGVDAAPTSGGGVNLYNEGRQLVHVYDDGGIQLAAGTTEADVQAFVSQQLLYTDPDDTGARQYGYEIGADVYRVDDAEAVQGLDILLDYFLDHDGNAHLVDGEGDDQG